MKARVIGFALAMLAMAVVAQAQEFPGAKADIAIGYSFNEGHHGDLGLAPRHGITIGGSYRAHEQFDIVFEALSNHSTGININAFSGGVRMFHSTGNQDGTVFVQALFGVVRGPVAWTVLDPLGRVALNVTKQVRMTGLNIDLGAGTDIPLSRRVYLRPQAGVRIGQFSNGMIAGMVADFHGQIAMVVRFGTR